MRAQSRLLRPVVAVLLAAACGSHSPPTDAPPPTATALPRLSGSGGGAIAFDSDRDGSVDLYLMNADGSDVRQLTDGPEGIDYAEPAWAPAGCRLAFHTKVASGRGVIRWLDLCIPNGIMAERQVTRKYDCQRPAWSPNGTELAFDAWRGRCTSICLAPAEGGDVRCLTEIGADADCFGPSWSPDGSTILCALHSHPGGKNMGWRIHRLPVNRHDSQEASALLTPWSSDSTADENTPAWSPDGKLVAFSAVSEGQWDIFVAEADGSSIRAATSGAGDDLHPTWSPDGSRLAFECNESGNWDICVTNVDGTGRLCLTHDPSADRHPSWRPETGE